jgi:hypothetical protein
LVHPLYFSPFYLSQLLVMISTCLKILYWCLYRKHFRHIHLLNFLLSPSPISDLPLVWSVFHNIAYICIVSIFHICEKTCSLCLSELSSVVKYWSYIFIYILKQKELWWVCGPVAKMATVEVVAKWQFLLVAHLRGSRIYFLEILVIERGF